jgi:hypothetical protein
MRKQNEDCINIYYYYYFYNDLYELFTIIKHSGEISVIMIVSVGTALAVAGITGTFNIRIPLSFLFSDIEESAELFAKATTGFAIFLLVFSTGVKVEPESLISLQPNISPFIVQDTSNWDIVLGEIKKGLEDC